MARATKSYLAHAKFLREMFAMAVMVELSHAFLAGVEVGFGFPSPPSTMLIAASVTGRATWLNVQYAKVGA